MFFPCTQVGSPQKEMGSSGVLKQKILQDLLLQVFFLKLVARWTFGRWSFSVTCNTVDGNQKSGINSPSWGEGSWNPNYFIGVWDTSHRWLCPWDFSHQQYESGGPPGTCFLPCRFSVAWSTTYEVLKSVRKPCHLCSLYGCSLQPIPVSYPNESNEILHLRFTWWLANKS